MAKDELHAFLSSGANFEGTLRFKGMVRVDCRYRGAIESEGILVLGDQAEIEGSINVGQLISSGRVIGDVRAADKVVLQKSSRLEGVVRTPFLDMDEGAIFDGELDMQRAPGMKTPKPRKPSLGPDSPAATAASADARPRRRLLRFLLLVALFVLIFFAARQLFLANKPSLVPSLEEVLTREQDAPPVDSDNAGAVGSDVEPRIAQPGANASSGQ